MIDEKLIKLAVDGYHGRWITRPFVMANARICSLFPKS